MRSTWTVLALAAVGLVGCGKGDGGNNVVAVNGANAPANLGSNNAEPNANANNEATNNAAANNVPTIPPKTKPKPKGPPPKFPMVDAPGTKGWSKDAQNALDLAAKVDASTKTLKDSDIHFKLTGRIPEGTGFAEGDMIVADQQRFTLRYARFMKSSESHFEMYIVRRGPNGDYMTLVGGKYEPGRVAPDPNILGGFFTDATHYLASGVGTNKTPLTDLVNAAQRAKWKIGVETKKDEVGVFKRILMDSPGTPKLRYELTIDPQQLRLTNFNADKEDKFLSQINLNLMYLKSDHPLTDADLDPNIAAKKITTITPDEAKKMGIKVPGQNKDSGTKN